MHDSNKFMMKVHFDKYTKTTQTQRRQIKYGNILRGCFAGNKYH